MVWSIVIIQGQPQIYLLILKGQIMGNFPYNLGGAHIWNKLPKDLKISKSYRQFKTSAKVYVQNYMNSLT